MLMMMNKKLVVTSVMTIAFVLLFITSITVTAAPDTELDLVKSHVLAKGKRWIAGETSISRLHPLERQRRAGGALPFDSLSENLDAPLLSPSPHEVTGAPSRLDYSDYYVTPVRDQGSCGSCWAFATTAALESQVLIHSNLPGADVDLAEQVLVSCAGAGSCKGGYISTASSYIRDVGLPAESCYPYTASNGSCSDACSTYNTQVYSTKGWHYVTTSFPTVDALRNALYQYGPLVTTMKVYTDFFYYKGGVYSYTWGNYQGAHAVLLVGYDDLGQYFIVKNSWGTGWGEAGFFRIDYDELYTATSFGYYTIAFEGLDGSPSPAKTTSLTVTSPDGGESWTAGSTQTIRWTYQGDPGSYVKIELLKGGSLSGTIASNVPAGSGGSGSFLWSIPAELMPGNDYRVRVVSMSDSSIADTSNGNFSITPPPSIAVVSPNGGESWAAGTNQTIRWSYTSDPGSLVQIELLKGGIVVSTISSGTSIGSGGSGSYTWTVPTNLQAGSDYRVRITSLSSGVTDTSDSDFAITAAPSSPTITVVSPNGGEIWYRGYTYTIRWTYTGDLGPYVQVDLLKGNILYRTVATNVSTGTEGIGSYCWTIPASFKTGSNFKIRVRSVSNPTIKDKSDASFTIAGISIKR